MKRKFIVIFLLLGIAFLAVTYMKYVPGVKSGQSSIAVKEGDAESARIVDFWKYYNKASVLRSLNNHREAIKHYQLALKLDSTHNNSLYYLGNMQLAVGNYMEARKYWNKLTAAYPESSRGYSQLGSLFSCREAGNPLYDLDKAADYFQKAFLLNREETGPILQLAKIDIMGGRYEEAEKKLNDIVSSNFRSIEAYFLIGYLKWKKGESLKAVQMLNKSTLLQKETGPESSIIGEGETKTGSSPMLSKENRCTLFSEQINSLVQNISHQSNDTDETYRQFNAEVIK